MHTGFICENFMRISVKDRVQMDLYFSEMSVLKDIEYEEDDEIES